MVTSTGSTIERQRLTVRGLVQGVGFRPFVYRQARRFGLSGYVLNDSAGVTIEVEGEAGAVAAFLAALQSDLPPLARIDSLSAQPLQPRRSDGFEIAGSQAGPARQTLISADTATCPDCLAELFDPADRRYRYPFINCTNCGPRYTIVQDVPYDRALTTMRAFRMCPACQAEYDDPASRRFHAQPNACPACGPQLRLLDRQGQLLAGPDPLLEAAGRLAEGRILAVKGLGGYHLACDALNAEATGRLRRLKRREAKPFALMVRDLDAARRWCELDEVETGLLETRRRPIVLARRRDDCPLPEAIAPGLKTLGLMLPYTPLHYLLLDAFSRVGGPALVMTSGNLSDEPIAYRDEDALARLAGLADGFLTHDRAIHIRCDDSVVRAAGNGPQMLRRSRGYAPEPLALPGECPLPLLACGGQLKNTFGLARGRQAFLSHHIGDLENLETLTSFQKGIAHLERLFDIVPQAVAYDLHPGYQSSQWAAEQDLPHKIGVQHHHAHIASVMAEHGLNGPVIGVAADGTGYGEDGCVWGCEILAAGLSSYQRLAHLDYLPLPGGEQAIQQPWRMAAVYLQHTFGPGFVDLDLPFCRGLDRARWRALAGMAGRGLNSPPVSSLGRLFDAVAAILGLREAVIYEGQAAIELETLAEPSERPYPFEIMDGTAPARLDARPLVRAIASDIRHGTPRPEVAGRFHRTVAEMLAEAVRRAGRSTGLRQVALSGGVFQNQLLLAQLQARLAELDFEVFINRQVPPNDGGLALGQLAVAAARLSEEPAGRK